MMNANNDITFSVDISKYNIICSIGGVQFKIINASCGKFTSSFKKHMHPFFELHCIVGGSGTLIIDDNKYPLKSGCVFITGPLQNHIQLTDMQDRMCEYCISFEADGQNVKNKLIADFLSLKFQIGYNSDKLVRYFQELANELEQQRIGWELSAELILSQIILFVMRSTSHSDPASTAPAVPDSRRSFLIDQAFLFNYKTLTLSSLARQVSLSERQLQRIIKEKYNMSFTELLKRTRVNTAADMLTNRPNMSIEQIAENTGFYNTVIFSKSFKEIMGVSPTEFKKRAKRPL